MLNLTIIFAAQQKDTAAQRAIFDCYGRILFRLAKRYLADSTASEDAVSESFYIIFKKIGSCDFQAIPPFEMWMKRIVVNECLQILRKEKRFDFLPEPEQSIYLVDDETIENLTAGEIFNLIEKLPAGYRAVFNLYEIEGYSHAEIADLLRISVGTSKSQLSKAKSLLQRQIIELDPVYAKRKIV